MSITLTCGCGYTGEYDEFEKEPLIRWVEGATLRGLPAKECYETTRFECPKCREQEGHEKRVAIQYIDPKAKPQCRCGKTISDTVYDKNGGLCNDCSKKYGIVEENY